MSANLYFELVRDGKNGHYFILTNRNEYENSPLG